MRRRQKATAAAAAAAAHRALRMTWRRATALRKQRRRAKQGGKQHGEGAGGDRIACMAQRRPPPAGVSSAKLMLRRRLARSRRSCARHTWMSGTTHRMAGSQLCLQRAPSAVHESLERTVVCPANVAAPAVALCRRDGDPNLEGHNRGRYAAAIMKRGLHQQARSRHLAPVFLLFPCSLLHLPHRRTCFHTLYITEPPCLTDAPAQQPTCDVAGDDH